MGATESARTALFSVNDAVKDQTYILVEGVIPDPKQDPVWSAVWAPVVFASSAGSVALIQPEAEPEAEPEPRPEPGPEPGPEELASSTIVENAGAQTDEIVESFLGSRLVPLVPELLRALRGAP